MRIPKRKGDGEVEPPLGGAGAAADDGAGANDAEARDDEAAAPLAMILSCDMPASTHAGELGHDARRRSMRACRERWPERLLRWAGEVEGTGLRLGERSCKR